MNESTDVELARVVVARTADDRDRVKVGRPGRLERKVALVDDAVRTLDLLSVSDDDGDRLGSRDGGPERKKGKKKICGWSALMLDKRRPKRKLT